MMTSYEKKYSADFFKKDGLSETNSDDKFQNGDAQTYHEENKSKENELSNGEETCSKGKTSKGEGTYSDNETMSGDKTCKGEIRSGGETNRDDEILSDDEEIRNEDEPGSKDELEFKSEDMLISQLYRKVVDVIMDSKSLTESTVDNAIKNIIVELSQAHKRRYKMYPGIDFDRPENCCGYLRRYAICYTGLVKKSMWNFFATKNDKCRTAKEDITSNSRLKIVSLGGGPGNDLVGFCSALQYIPNNVNQLELTVVDASEGWRHVFPEILKNAKTDFGSFSQFLRKEITHHFIKADLTNDQEFRGINLSSALKEADLLLMVKLTSYLSNNAERYTLLKNVAKSMKPEARLIFIDSPYEKEFFRETESLDSIYHGTLRYKLDFNPGRYQSPAIEESYAHVAIHEKKVTT